MEALFITIFAIAIVIWYMKQNSKSKDKISDSKPKEIEAHKSVSTRTLAVTILYATQTGTSKKLANQLAKLLRRSDGIKVDLTVCSLKSYAVYDLEHEQYVIVIIPTWTSGTHVKDAEVFASALKDATLDFRISKQFLKKMKLAIFGLGNAEYDEHFCAAAKSLEKDFKLLGAQVIQNLGLGDDNVDMAKEFLKWSDELLINMKAGLNPVNLSISNAKESTIPNQNDDMRKQNVRMPLKEYRRKKKLEAKSKAEANKENENGLNVEDDTEDKINAALLAEADAFAENSESESESEAIASKERAERAMEMSDAESINDDVLDMEDLGKVIQSSKEKSDEEAEEAKNNIDGTAGSIVRDMVTPAQRRALIKEGYKIIGTHSAVKLCRWTKNQLRGRGGCYKHTFYGITSYQCMEATPSLACANKCVFCWRHHKNPVGREWRWSTDDPERIISEAITKHQAMIKETKGIPGVRMDRWADAFNGEPIMYPRINEFLGLLHKRDISSFLVTNAQFPKEIKDLDPCTQLYVSVDAATKKSLKAVDRPLFKDFWERFVGSLKALREKGQRTVYRMTLVKSWNMEEAKNYVELIQLGDPDFIEIKAVTYCGKSDGSNLTMDNVPWHDEVRNYATHICESIGGTYGIAAEHRHSCCMLLAKQKFNVNGQWNTWIDYDKFHSLMKSYYESGSNFTAEDYMCPTPYWAVFGAKEEGFSPFENKWKRKIGMIDEGGCG